MTNRRLSPQKLLLGSGLVITLLAGWGDLDVARITQSALSMNSFDAYQEELRKRQPPATYPDSLPGMQRVEVALGALEDAQEAFVNGHGYALNDLERFDKGLDGGWEGYWERRAEPWAAYSELLEAARETALEAGRDEPDNGAYDVLAGLLSVELALGFGPFDPMFDMELSVERSGSRLVVRDAGLLEGGLAEIDRGLSRSRIDFHTAELAQTAWESHRGTPLEQLAERLAVKTGFNSTCLSFLRWRCGMLTLLALKLRQSGEETGEAVLRRTRRLGLRIAADATVLREVLVGQLLVLRADQAWMKEASVKGDLALLEALHGEYTALVDYERQAMTGRPVDVDRSRLGTAHGWARVAGLNPGEEAAAAGRQLDYTALESFFVWALIGLCTLWVLLAAWRARPVAHTPTDAGLPRASWTLGDAFCVVLPSFVAALLVALCVHRWGPLGDWGIWAGRRPLLAPFVRYSALLLAGGFGYAWLLRRRVLLRHGLDWSRPGLAQLSLGLVLAAAGLCVTGVGPFSFVPGAVAAGLFVVGVAVAWRAGVVGRPCADRTQAAVLRGFEGRVGLACLGVALCLIGVVELVAVTPRRHRLATQVDQQVLTSWTHSAANWGYLREDLQELLQDQGDAPTKFHYEQ